MTASGRVKLRIRRLPGHDDLPLPRPASAGAAGIDLAAAVRERIRLASGRRCVVPCGIAVEIPGGWEGQVRPRSGLAAEHGITVLNAPGTVDSDYRGELAVILVNHGDATVEIRRGDRIAQLVLCPVAAEVEVEEAADLSETARGSGGFGSTGV